MNIIPIDFEAYYDPQFSLSKITTEEYIRSPQFETIGVSIWHPGAAGPTWYTDPLHVAHALQSIDWANSAMLAHNCALDGAIAAWRYGVQPKMYFDTMGMAQPLFGFTSGVSLAKLAEVLGLGVKGTEVVQALGKRRKNFTHSELAAYGSYCNNDNVLCRKIFEHLLPLTPRKELAAIDSELRCFVDPRIVLDIDMLRQYHQNIIDRKQTNYIWLGNLLGCGADDVKDIIMSNDKMAHALTELGVDPPRKLSPTTGKVAWAFAKTDADFLALKEHEDETVQLLVETRLGGKSTLTETRALRLIEIALRGTLPVMLKHYAAHTGRLGGGDAINMQNLPRKGELRDSLCAPPNHLFVGGDLSQIEARVLACIAGQEDVVRAFADFDAGIGPDIYCVTATAFLGRPITKANDPKERQLGKVIRLALGYGMGIDKFIVTAARDGVVLTPQQAAAAHKWFRDTNEYIARLWKAGDRALEKLLAGEEWTFGKDGCIVVKADGLHLPSGRVLRYPGLEREKNEFGWQYTYLNRKKRVKVYGAKVIENICQSIAGSVVMDAWIRLRGKMHVCMQVHDELVGLVHEEQREHGLELMHRALTAPVPWLPSLPVACEVGAAARYGHIVKKPWKGTA